MACSFKTSHTDTYLPDNRWSSVTYGEIRRFGVTFLVCCCAGLKMRSRRGRCMLSCIGGHKWLVKAVAFCNHEGLYAIKEGRNDGERTVSVPLLCAVRRYNLMICFRLGVRHGFRVCTLPPHFFRGPYCKHIGWNLRE